MTRRGGDSKRRLDTNDIVEFYSVLDTKQLLDDIPHFVACDLSRIPPFMPDATDFCSLAASVEFLHGQVNDIYRNSYHPVVLLMILTSHTVELMQINYEC